MGMYKTLTTLLIASGLTLLSACDGKNSLEVGVPVSENYLIDGDRRSCALIKGEAVTNPDEPGPNDIKSMYFQIERVNFKWSDPNSNLLIRTIKLTFPGGEMPSCTISGVDLLALNNKWYTSQMALIGSMTMYDLNDVPLAVQPSYITAIDCAIMCGGIAPKSSFTATGIMEVKGTQVDKYGNALNEKSGLVSTSFTIINE